MATLTWPSPASVPWLRWVPMAVAWIATIGVAAWYLADPHGDGATALSIAFGVFCFAIMIGPIVRKARPVRVWMPVILGGFFFLLSLASETVETPGSDALKFSDVFYFAGYACFTLWLLGLAEYLGGSRDRTAMLDASASTTATALVLWTLALAPQVGDSGVSYVVIWGMYAIFDVMLLSLSIHVWMHLGHLPRALLYLIATLAFVFPLDIINAVVPQGEIPRGDMPILLTVYLFVFFGLAAAGTHPSLPELSRRSVDPAKRRYNGRRTAFILFTVSPAAVATAVPSHGFMDMLVRTVLVSAILLLLFLRLWTTMGDLQIVEEDNIHRATHDPLTGLLNRAALAETQAGVVARGAATGRSTAVLFVDCDDFKSINDTWGHHAGDNLLRHIADRLPSCLGPDDLLARHGGDEFVIVASVSGTQEAIGLAERIRHLFDEPLPILPDRTHNVTPSIGVAVAGPGDGSNVEELVRMADSAMYETKARGRGGYVLFDDELAERTRTRAVVGDRLGDAIRDDAFSIRLQPIMGGEGYSSLVGWEALARWHDDELGDVPPDVFIPVAEHLGLIGEIGELVLRRACHELARLRAVSPEDELRMSVNVSPAQLLAPDFADVVRDARDSAGLPNGALWLEVTETLLVDRGLVVLEALTEIREFGVGIAIDDFGTGYASLGTLLRLPTDCVKLDRSLVTRLDNVDGKRQLTAVLDLLHSLGITRIIAEGVETSEQATVLRELGCPMVQGWLYGHPTTTESMLAAHVATA
ncbi:putative bifunctional diguanylate cyclase/phosphodiesterase [Mobilicoccus massiliensis]|uniref:putative bifunctional diguanylate cyclase/phosphodiesterase n=1 Tax=Mobilicoccus massiliensis TaxID=1522310 RepID=UPI00069495D1|nr:bifunctional diguanylate cyclase/phosphodiesterase [Mobilicoccus massiliensis]